MNKSKQFKNVSISDITGWIRLNPNKGRKLIYNSDQKKTVYHLENINLSNVETMILDPPNILSNIKYLEDPMFEITSVNDRLSIIRESIPGLIEQLSTIENKRVARKKKRIIELVSNSLDNVPINTDDMKLLYEGLSSLKNLQFVLVDADPVINPLAGTDDYTKNIYFSSNPINWVKDVPIHIADFRSKWTAKTLNTNIRKWLENLEKEGWNIDWPIEDDTKKNMIEQLEKTHIWQESFKKSQKDELALILGKHKTLQTLCNFET